MGGFSGKYSRNPFATFEEEKNYACALMQEGIPVTDDDENSNRLQLLHQFRRGNQLFGDYGTPNDGFQIKEATAPANDFKITGGGPSNTDIEAAGRFFMRGHQCVLMHDITYYNARSDISEQSIHPRITRVYLNGGNTVVEDSAANWVATELVGRSVRIGTTNRTIADNGVDWFTITGDHTGGVDPILNLAYYILRLTPPVALTRDDGVYLNVYVDEYDENDDSTIEKQIGGVAVVAQLRAKIMQTLFVRQGVTALGELVDYVDSDGNQHYVSKLATILRTTSNDITTAMITDLVPTIGFTSIGLDHMTPLHASAQSPAAATVAVSPGTALKASGSELVTFAGGSSPTIAGQAADERYDALVLRDNGTLDVIVGVPGTIPATRPRFTGVPIAYIKVDEDPAVITDADITDARCIFTQGPGYKLLSPDAGTISAQLADLAITAGDRFWLPPGNYTLGANVDITGDDVIIAGGRGAIVDMAAYKLTLSGANCKVEGINLHVTADSTTVPVVVISGNECKLLDVEIDDDGSHYRLYAVHILNTASRCLIDQCIIDGVANTGTTPGAIMFETGGTNNDCRITRCNFTLLSSSKFAIQGNNSATACVISENRITFPSTGSAIESIRTHNFWRVSKNIITGHASVTSGYGISCANATDYTIEDNFITLCTTGGISLSVGTRATVRDNVITECAYAVIGTGTYAAIKHNKIVNSSRASSIGLSISGTYNVIEGNNLVLAGTASGVTGIQLVGIANKVIGNHVVIVTSAAYGSIGIKVAGDSLVEGNYVSVSDGGDHDTPYTNGIWATESHVRVIGNYVAAKSSNLDNAIPARCLFLNFLTDSIINSNSCEYPGGGAAPSQGILVAGTSLRLVVQGNHVYAGFDANEGIDMGNATNSVAAGNVLRGAMTNVTGVTVTGANVAI